jgi:poly(hydroxyalkanoate) granule-associated protein
MARKKSRKPRTARSRINLTQERLLETVHQVWLAGIGAVAKARKESPKLFEELVREGARVQVPDLDAAQEAFRHAFAKAKTKVGARVGETREQVADTVANLEKIFQTRVHRALKQLGVPSADEVSALSKRVDKLNTNIDKLASTRGSARRRRTKATHGLVGMSAPLV